jgi:hypothetical protein
VLPVLPKTNRFPIQNDFLSKTITILYKIKLRMKSNEELSKPGDYQNPETNLK